MFTPTPIFATVPKDIHVLKSFVNHYHAPHHAKICFMLYANNKDADQPVHPHSLISACASA